MAVNYNDILLFYMSQDRSHSALILLGGNAPETRSLFNKSISRIEELAGAVVKVSGVYESTPWGFEAESLFLNCVIEVRTRMEARALLKVLLNVESELGRVRQQSGGYSSRSIDLDLLFFDDVIVSSDDLILPHPRLHLRRFTLTPLNEQWPDRVHPTIGKSVNELLAQCPDEGLVKRCD